MRADLREPVHLKYAYEQTYTADFRQWVEENTVCLPGSVYSKQVAACVSSYLWYSTNGDDRGEKQLVWRNIYKPRIIENWLKLHAQNKGPSSLYNYVSYSRKVASICFSRLGMDVPNCFMLFLNEEK